MGFYKRSFEKPIGFTYPLKMEFIGFDIETTGTLSHIDHIVEIAGVRFKEGQITDTYQSLVQIKEPMPKEASAINGITDEMLENQPFIAEVLPEFASFCGNTFMVAHNAVFDFQFIARAIQECQSPAPKGGVLDTYNLARKVFPGQVNYKLATLCDFLKIKSEKFHRAQADALACGQLFQKIMEKLPFDTVEEIIHFSGKKPLRFPEVFHNNQLSFF